MKTVKCVECQRANRTSNRFQVEGFAPIRRIEIQQRGSMTLVSSQLTVLYMTID